MLMRIQDCWADLFQLRVPDIGLCMTVWVIHAAVVPFQLHWFFYDSKSGYGIISVFSMHYLPDYLNAFLFIYLVAWKNK